MMNTDNAFSSLSPEERETAAKELLRLLNGTAADKNRDGEIPALPENRKSGGYALPVMSTEAAKEPGEDMPFGDEAVYIRESTAAELTDPDGMERISDFFSRDCRRYDRAFKFY